MIQGVSCNIALIDAEEEQFTILITKLMRAIRKMIEIIAELT